MDAPPDTLPRPTGRTYKQRRGRIGPTRAAALEQLLPRHGVAVEGPALDLRELFDDRPVVLEIGCGHGDATVAAATAEPGVGILAVDVHAPGIATLLQAVEAHALTNVRVAHGDALLLLRHRIAAASLAGVRILYPDPWPKARHHKRRLVSASTVALVADRCAAGALVHVVTDDPGYAAAASQVLDAEPRLATVDPRGAPTFPTRYAAMAARAGRQAHVLLRRRVVD